MVSSGLFVVWIHLKEEEEKEEAESRKLQLVEAVRLLDCYL